MTGSIGLLIIAIFDNNLIYDNSTALQVNFFDKVIEPEPCSVVFSAMAKKEKSTERAKQTRGRPSLGKKTVSIRLSEDVLAEVKKAAASGGNLSAYIEEALKEKLSIVNGLTPKPNFRKRFSRPAKGPRIEGGLVKLILEDREAS